MKKSLRVLSLLIGLLAVFYFAVPSQSSVGSLDRIKERGLLLWGSDAEGGAPYVFPDPEHPDTLIGFEVDIADAIAREFGVNARQVQNAWDSLIPALERGDFDIAMNGIEITPQREAKIFFSIPYYVYTEQLAVGKDETRISDINDLSGMKVGTLSGAVAQDILMELGGVDVRTYSGQAEPYEDLALGRLDAVLLDLPIAAYYAKPNPKLKYAGPPVGEGFYGIAIRKEDENLKRAIDEAIGTLLETGELKRIYEKWDMWNETQEKLYLYAKGYERGVTLEEAKQAPIWRFFPMLLKGAGITILISVFSMALAIVLGLVLTLMRMYGRPPLSAVATSYIELYRGTPLLIQLYILYYGLPNVGIALSPIVAAFLGLGMNYAAYEAELYRAGISAIPKGQTEAALSLGMTQGTTLRRVILPQALRIALPGVTNDFIALFKDSSLVSIIAMVELTKTYNILAATTLRFFELGLIVAFLYLAMSYPLSLLARSLEERLKGKKR
ncbi:MAG: ABC transporter permease subunit [Candidatus Abyssobacteria bacterium SURF_17]|jgi:polar amino acid transport system substrate-binding protein|uniref:Putative glutamine transport system permease protein GlnP n=1 Tax=Candidatus Abyssobacteria bacterium SURF_17 TaxID=2093361 RepID=A0A419EYX3_9BACT|nr:MAG: ABC transporter permease subunit [Candidatus Abyssubacteria bacterium SURF_17]